MKTTVFEKLEALQSWLSDEIAREATVPRGYVQSQRLRSYRRVMARLVPITSQARRVREEFKW